eukprot:scaffold28298_cov68-Phaeocystis_antarctica.AAC.4
MRDARRDSQQHPHTRDPPCKRRIARVRERKDLAPLPAQHTIKNREVVGKTKPRKARAHRFCEAMQQREASANLLAGRASHPGGVAVWVLSNATCHLVGKPIYQFNYR